MNSLILIAFSCNIFLDALAAPMKDIFKIEESKSVGPISVENSSTFNLLRQKRFANHSYVFFDNRSGRMAELSYRKTTKKESTWQYFGTLKPGGTLKVNTFENHKWMAKEIDGKRLMINNKKWWIQKANAESDRATCIITYPDQSEKDIEIGEKFVETLVVVDKSVRDRFNNKGEARDYVEVLMKLASEIYQHKSLSDHGLQIHIVPSRIDFLKHEVKLDSSRGERNMYDVCKLMNKRATGSFKFDHKLFLTRNSFGAGGYARNGAMCSETSSCSMVYDHGFTSAFMIAHEIAHSFGVSHGDFQQFSRHIMAPIVDSQFNNYAWSKHSQHSLLEHIRNYKCLDNIPNVEQGSNALASIKQNTDEGKNFLQYPGTKFSLDKQCKLEYDDGYSAWTGWKEDPCAKLKCRMPGKYSFLSKSSGSPALDGTNCGENKWCLAGKCQVIGPILWRQKFHRELIPFGHYFKMPKQEHLQFQLTS